MKAKVIKTGEIIEVSKCIEAQYLDEATFGIDEKVYNESDLDFNTPATEKAVIEGYATLDECDLGMACVHSIQPILKSMPIADTGDYECVWSSEGKIYLLDKSLIPTLTFENSPQRVKIEITLIGEKGE